MAYDRILRAIKTFDNSKNGLAWIVRITQNEAYKLNREEVSRDESLEKYIALEEYKDTSPVVFNENERLNKYDIERAIARLDDQERTIIEYKVFMDMTFREISKEMNIPKSAVAYVLKQALKKLDKYLK
ncbi:MAG: sigma-70 family RNA polymerase sigma factor [Clostridiales bacterium]|nr:sigma-70 family RNA polymerase sigma factor [Clostridiales bacterium]